MPTLPSMVDFARIDRYTRSLPGVLLARRIGSIRSASMGFNYLCGGMGRGILRSQVVLNVPFSL